jgi:hypothetical protein
MDRNRFHAHLKNFLRSLTEWRDKRQEKKHRKADSTSLAALIISCYIARSFSGKKLLTNP